ncbi:MAG: hypothetical protein KKA42_07170, partial [candidate division Zixibacteria bacterium]|nr:hypothetical protein [candidate division Zixibacteria bacterium]
NRDLNKLVADEKFRQDLYYRISVMMIEVPPLSARSEDIPLLVGEFLKRFDPAGETHFAPAAMAALSASTYPGNVRQLKNLVERMTILRAGRTVEVQALGLAASELPVTNVATDESASLATRLARFERELVAHTLRECKGNISETARQLQVDRANLSRKIHELGLKPGDH